MCRKLPTKNTAYLYLHKCVSSRVARVDKVLWVITSRVFIIQVLFVKTVDFFKPCTLESQGWKDLRDHLVCMQECDSYSNHIQCLSKLFLKTSNKEDFTSSLGSLLLVYSTANTIYMNNLTISPEKWAGEREGGKIHKKTSNTATLKCKARTRINAVTIFFFKCYFLFQFVLKKHCI